MNLKPLVVSQDGTAQLEQLQPGDDLDISLETRHADLERRFRLLLADYIQKFGPVPSLGDENALAQATGV